MPDQLAWHRGLGTWSRLPDLAGKPDLAALRSVVKEDRATNPDGNVVEIFVDLQNQWKRAAPVLGLLMDYPTRLVQVQVPPADAPAEARVAGVGWLWQLHPFVSLDLPSFTSGRPMGGPRLSLRADGGGWLEDQPLPDLTTTPIDAALGGKTEEVRLFVDGQLPAEKLAPLLRSLKVAGVRRIGLSSPRVPGLALPVVLESNRSVSQITVQLGTLGLSVGRGEPELFLGKATENLDRLVRILQKEGSDPSDVPSLHLELDPRVQVAELVPVLDALTAAGWSYPSLEIKLGAALVFMPRAPIVPYRSPLKVSISQDGTFVLDNVRISLPHIAAFFQRCDQGTCATFVALENQEQWYLGRFPERPAEEAPWIFQRPVYPWTGELPRREPEQRGSLRMLVGGPVPTPAPSSRQTVENGAATGDSLTDAVVACYTEALGRNPACRGTIVVSAMVGSDGNMLGARLLSSTLGDQTADSCIVEAVQKNARTAGMRSNGITTVQYPFNLSPG